MGCNVSLFRDSLLNDNMSDVTDDRFKKPIDKRKLLRGNSTLGFLNSVKEGIDRERSHSRTEESFDFCIVLNATKNRTLTDEGISVCNKLRLNGFDIFAYLGLNPEVIYVAIKGINGYKIISFSSNPLK